MYIYQENIAFILTLLYVGLFVYGRKVKSKKLDADINLYLKYVLGLAIGLIHCFIGSALLYSSSKYEIINGVFFSLYLTFPAIFIARWNTGITALLLFIGAFLSYPLVIRDQECEYKIVLYLAWTIPMLAFGVYFLRNFLKNKNT